jgi:hypothetical protein
VVALGQLALDTFCSAAPPREQCPKYLARLVPVERTCPATVADIVEAAWAYTRPLYRWRVR